MNAVVPIMRNAAQAAGKVLKPGQVSVRFDLGGDKRLHDKVSKEMLEELRGLLELANFGGTFLLVVLRLTKGSSATKGIIIRNPHEHGVTLTGHYGDNGSCLMCILCCPRFVDPAKFHSELKRVHRGLDEANEKEQNDSKSPASSEVISVPTKVSSVKEEAQELLASEEEDPRYTDYREFTKSSADVELLMLHLMDRAKDGVIPKEVLTGVLVETWNFNPQRVGPIHRHLRSKGLVVEMDETFYKLKSEAPVQAPLTGFAAKIADLEKLAAPFVEIDRERQEIARKMAELQAKMKPIADELSELARKDAELEETLKKSNPRALEALTKLQEINKLIGD